jgi:hypothetical protein
MQRCGFEDWRFVERARLSPRYPPSSFAPGLFDPGFHFVR